VLEPSLGAPFMAFGSILRLAARDGIA